MVARNDTSLGFNHPILLVIEIKILVTGQKWKLNAVPPMAHALFPR